MMTDNGTVRRKNVIFDLPTHPCSRESLREAMVQNEVHLAHKDLTQNIENVHVTMAHQLLKGEWFDFGRIDSEELSKAATDSHDIIVEKMAHPPYSSCIFRIRMTHEDSEMEVALSVWKIDDEIHLRFFRIVGLRANQMILTAGATIGKGWFKPLGDHLKESQICGKLYGGLWIILNCRGVRKDVREPDAKLNRARARRGRDPLQRVTVVDAASYITALKETERMEGAGEASGRSSKPHLRRGHLRRYLDKRYERLHVDGVRIFRGQDGVPRRWMEPMLINADQGEPEKRDGYRI